MTSYNIDIHFSSFVNEGHSVDTQIRAHNLTLGDDQKTILGTQKPWLHFRHQVVHHISRK